jgi:hypothetical protein
MSESEQFIFGHKQSTGRKNIQKRLREISADPMTPLVRILQPKADPLLSDDISAYRHAYQNYYLSMARFLPEMSLARRYSDGPGAVRKSGGKYTESERRIAVKFRPVAPFLEFDLLNCVIHCRILMDRVAGLADRFLVSEKSRPSFSSFSDHKKFFQKLKAPYGHHEEYAEYIRSSTAWFDMPLKHVRDNYVMHLSPKHMRFLGSSGSGPVLELNIIVAKGGKDKPLSPVKMVTVSPFQMSYEVQEFLTWFAAYGAKALSS